MGIKMGIASILMLFALSTFAFADEVEIPFGVHLEPFKAELKAMGLDFYGAEKSMGFIEDRGSMIVLFTYKTISVRELETIQSILWNHVRK